MLDPSILLTVTVFCALPLVAFYWLARYYTRRRQAKLLRQGRPWQLPTIQNWVMRGWLDPESTGLLPAELLPAKLFWDWASVDPDAALHWRIREKLMEATPAELLVREAWDSIPQAQRAESRRALAAAVAQAARPYGGSEQGWAHRPFVVLSSDLPRRAREPLPMEGADDMTAAEIGAPVHGEKMAAEADGPDLVLALYAIRASKLRYTHPLAPRQGGAYSMISGVSTRLGGDVGRRVGGGIGAALGPIGSMIGQYLGGVAGEMGGRALAKSSLPSAATEALRQTEDALASLGSLTARDDLLHAAELPSETVVLEGQKLEPVRERRSRSMREGFWPSTGLVIVEEALRIALIELRTYREAAAQFVLIARKAPAAVAGGMILQNPWLVHRLPGGAERLNQARAALNRAATALRRLETPAP